MKAVSLLFCWLFFFGFLKAQEPGKKTDTLNIYKLYEVQFSQMMMARGVGKNEINEILSKYRTNEIKSDSDFANSLKKFYSTQEKIGVITFFFKEDSLRRVFLKPGNVIEQKTIHITKKELLQLSYDFNHAIGLYERKKDRMPTKRGITLPDPPKSEGLSYDSLIKYASQLLIPEKFDDQYQHLLIIPALNIGTIPFYLLKPYGNDSLLIDKCSYTIVPSIIDLLGLRSRTLKEFAGSYFSEKGLSNDFHNRTFAFTLSNPLFISNPAYPVNTEFLFPDLPGAKKEIENAIPFAKNYRLFEGKDAVKDSVLKYIRQSDVVYFATHGIADEEKPMEKSFLVLSGKDPFLTAKDIMDNRNDTRYGRNYPEMVILSACQTGLGKAMEAGVIGLTRSFLVAGSNHVIMSLWNVDDEATAYLMNRFIYHLQQENRFMPSEPLRLAMLDTRKKFTEPSQWASFALFGIDY